MAQSTTLKPGTILHWYRIDSVLGYGGFGLTYLAEDTNLHQKVAIKEYLPGDLAERHTDSTVKPRTENHEEVYAWGLDRFLKEARTLVQFKHPNIIRVMSVFEANNTAYMVMEYEEGEDLEHLMLEQKYNSEQELKHIVYPILDGLVQVHNAGFIHRDIKPGNIYIRKDGSPVLLDFGSARQSVGSQTQALTSLYTPGFAPYEQYHEAEGQQGPWTDIYAMGATMYLGVTGRRPVDAMKRSAAYVQNTKDPYVPVAQSTQGRFSRAFLHGIDAALRFHGKDRPQNAGAFKDILEGKQESENTGKADVRHVPEKHKGDTKGIGPVYIGTFLLVVCVIAAGLWWWQQDQQSDSPDFAAVEKQSETPVNEVQKSGENEPALIESLMKQAEIYWQAKQYVVPEDKNALDLYYQVLAMDAGHPEALARVKNIKTLIMKHVERLIASGQYDRAEQDIDTAKSRLQDHTMINDLNLRLLNAKAEKARLEEEARRIREEEIARRKAGEDAKRQAELRAEQEKVKAARARAIIEKKEKQKADALRKQQQRISQLLVQAADDIANGRLANEPDNNDALTRYREVLKIDPGNRTALNGIATLTDKLAEKSAVDKKTISSNTAVGSDPIKINLIGYGETTFLSNKVMTQKLFGYMKSAMKEVFSGKVDYIVNGTFNDEEYFYEDSIQDKSVGYCKSADILIGVNFERYTTNTSNEILFLLLNCKTKSIDGKSFNIWPEGSGAAGEEEWDNVLSETMKVYLHTASIF